MLAAQRWTRWFIRRVIEFGCPFISKSQKGHRAGTNVRQTMSALRWRGKWKWEATDPGRAERASRAMSLQRRAQRSMLKYMKCKVSLIHEGNLTPTELCFDCRKIRERQRCFFFLLLDIFFKKHYWILMSAKWKLEKFRNATMFVLFTLKNNRRIGTGLNTQFKYTDTRGYKRHVLYHLKELET